MIVVSDDFKIAMKQPVKDLQAFIAYDDVVISDDSDLISFKISCDSGLCKSAMRKLEAKYLEGHNIVGKWVTAGFGVKLSSGSFEPLEYGSFLVSEQTTTKDTGVTDIVAYDKMINAMTPYSPVSVDYPIDLYAYTEALCGACGLELGDANSDARYFHVNVVDNTVYYKISAYNYGLYYDNMTKDTSTKYNLKPIEGATGKNYGFQVYEYTDGNGATKWCHAETQVLTYTETTEEIQSVHDGNLVDGAVTDMGSAVYAYNVDGETRYYVVYGNNCVTSSNWSLPIERELWENISGITYRDIFAQIAQATGSTCIIGADDKVYFKTINNTGEQLTYDNMFKLKLEPTYGAINSVVLARSPMVGEDIFLLDEASVDANGLTEFRIENNEIVDKDRETAVQGIADVLFGLSYTPFEATTEGLGWYEIGDSFDIVNDTGDVFPAILWGYSITIDGGIKETLKATAETKTQTQYQYATSIAKRVKNTEIIVNKQEEYIQSLVSDMYEEDGVVNNKYSQIRQEIGSIVQSVQNSGGGNLLKNSVMFEYDKEGKPTSWKLNGDGLTIQSDAVALSNGGVSGHSFTLLDSSVLQRVNVKANTADDSSSYSFSCRIKKGAVGSCLVKIYNEYECYEIPLSSGETPHYAEYERVKLEPQQNYYIVEISASGGNGATFTDCMFASGEYKSKWTQANGEVMNTQVNVSVNGVLVRSSVYAGDYTVMSPLEFAGYSLIGGTPTCVFSLNKDVTNVRKLKAVDEIKMGSIKIVPITSGNLQGWAFVPTS